MEDYKKKYEEALERAREFINQVGTHNLKVDSLLEQVFPELAESEDEKIRKDLIEFVNQYGDKFYGTIAKASAISWLEKQKENNIIYTDEYDTKKCLTSFLKSLLEQGGIMEEGWSSIECEKYISWLEKQNPANNAEPKFKVGDWCIDNEDGTIFQILKVLDNIYTYRTTEGKGYSCSYSALEIDAKLWTIQDAKDGDVLAAHECYVIFKEIDGLNIKCYCAYHYMGFNPSFYVDTLQNKNAFYPATKEQRDLLLQKMKEAGYEWNAEKKELKRIEQKSVEWSEHQHKLLNYAISMTEDTEVKNFLESLRSHPIHKQEWSDVDEYQFNTILHHLDLKAEIYKKEGNNAECDRWQGLYNWLKSLKPQSKQEWGEEDENTRNKIIGSLDALKFYVEKNNEFNDERVESNLKELDDEIEWLQDIVPQQKQEWNDKDEKMFLDIECLIHSYRTGSYEHELSSWLKFLKDRCVPQSKQEWNEEDEKMCNNLIEHFDWNADKRFTHSDCDRAISWLKSIKPQNTETRKEESVIREVEAYKKELKDAKEMVVNHHPEEYSLQKQCEWSKEDENKLQEAIGMVEANGCWIRSKDAVKGVSDWLNSLKDRVLPQPKQEWSEEDEENMIDLLKYLEINLNECIRKDEIISWLKSLKPQPHWKPSEEQLEALKLLINYYHKNANEATTEWKAYDNLISLYEKLRKL